MVEFKSFQMFLILMIPFTAVTQHRSFIPVRAGDEATLPCEDVKDYQDKCQSTTWFFNYLKTGPSETLFEHGKFHREAASKSHRLNVTEKCSLVIKKVTDEDVGLYTCRQFDESGKLVKYSDADLTLTYTAVTQHYSRITVRAGDETTLLCEDVTDYHDKCLSTTWTFNYLTTAPALTLFEYGKIPREAASKSYRLSVTEKCSLVIKKVTDEDVGHYTCRQFDEGQTVTDSQVDLTVIKIDNVATPPTRTTKLPTTTTKRTPKLSSTSKRTTKITKATTRSTTTKATRATTRPTTTKATRATTRPTTTKATRTTTRPTPTTKTTDPAAGETSPNADLLKVLIPVAVVSAALLIIVVIVIRWKRAKGNNTQLDDNTADPPDGVSYASIRYKKKTKRKAQVQGEDDMVTYSTLNTFSTSAGASTDPRRLYISINKTNT